ncbi:DUF1824 family protein [Geminocystis sp.]|uniref:DUF1824 family protein n=1 Tax=Geminocystis sp. TaxID=2664100 RepID=UPI0035945ADE
MNQDINKALNLLKKYSGIELKIVNSEEEKQALQSALKLIVSLSDNENLGICASTEKEAFNTLQNYLKALGYSFNLEDNLLFENKAIYLKFSTEKMSYYVSDYQGEYRGVLITIFADSQDEIIGTYGYLPLNLFN